MPTRHAHRLRSAGCVALATCALLTGCQSRQIDATLLVTPEEAISFSRDVQPLLAGSCAGCHIGERTSGVALGTYEQVTTSVGERYGEQVVVPGAASASPLIDKIGPSPRLGERMPLGRSPLASDQISVIRTWIDEGALDN